jgi:hypothetical protein
VAEAKKKKKKKKRVGKRKPGRLRIFLSRDLFTMDDAMIGGASTLAGRDRWEAI